MSDKTAQPPETAPRALVGVLGALEVPMLVLVPAVLLWCALAGVRSSAGLTLLVALMCVALFMASYEASRPALRQLMPTVVLAAVAAAGRVALAPVPDIKPVSAIAIVAGACLGRRNGFMCGALAALASNMFFGQGPWTPMQMYAWGLIGYLGGVLAEHGAFEHRWALLGYGLASGLIYGLVLNSWHVVGFVRPITWQTVLAAFAAGIHFDVMHGVSTAIFLALIWEPWARRIERTVRAYGL
ncbi:MAG: ECF transporter S component [Olsenella sp.]|nr:ECF transporter S component [Olsenella sp.]